MLEIRSWGEGGMARRRKAAREAKDKEEGEVYAHSISSLSPLGT